MEWSYRLLKYRYRWYCQGTEEWDETYALIHAPEDASFENIRSTLINQHHNENDHYIDIDSIENLTIEW